MTTRKLLILTTILLSVILIALLSLLPTLLTPSSGNLSGTTGPSLESTSSVATTEGVEQTLPSTLPLPTTEPPVPTLPAELAFSTEGLLCNEFFIYDCAAENLMAISCDLDKRLYPASITKLFTAYVALQYLDPEDVITVGDALDMVGYGSSVANLAKGNQLTVSQLVEGMMLPSGNDAAYVLAVAAARAQLGTQKSASGAAKHFVDLMNQHAQQEGMTGTHFCNPDGYHNDNHYTTPADLITLAQLALSVDSIRQCVGIVKDTVTFVSGETVEWENTNALLNPESEYYCPEAIGLKTGKTNRSGYCLLAAFELEGQYVIIGVFGGAHEQDRFQDTVALFTVVKGSLG